CKRRGESQKFRFVATDSRTANPPSLRCGDHAQYVRAMNLNVARGGRKRLCWGILLLLAVSCGDGAQTTSYVDNGEACITSTEQGGAVVRVSFRTCLSSSCDTLQ